MPHPPPSREIPLVRGALPLVGAVIGVWTGCAKPRRGGVPTRVGQP